MLVPPVLWPFLASRSHQTSPCAERPSQHSGNLSGLHVVRREQPGTLPPPRSPSLFLGPGLVTPAADDQRVPALSSTIGYAQQHRHRIRTPAQHQHPASSTTSQHVPAPCPQPRASLGTQHPALPRGQHPARWTCSLAGTCSPRHCCAAASSPYSLHRLLCLSWRPWSCRTPIPSALAGM